MSWEKFDKAATVFVFAGFLIGYAYSLITI